MKNNFHFKKCTGCVICDRWLHNACNDNESNDDYICPICKNSKHIDEVVGNQKDAQLSNETKKSASRSQKDVQRRVNDDTEETISVSTGKFHWQVTTKNVISNKRLIQQPYEERCIQSRITFVSSYKIQSFSQA